MEQSGFNALLENINSIKSDDLAELEALRKQYPYFQNIHLLLAKGYQSTNSDQLKPALNRAAIYSVNRLHLKQVLNNEHQFIEIIKTPRSPLPPKPELKITEEAAPPVSPKKEVPHITKVVIEQKEAETPVETKKEAPEVKAEIITPASSTKDEPLVKETVEKKPIEVQKPETTLQEHRAATLPAQPSKDGDGDVYEELEENLKLLSARKKAMLAFLDDKPVAESKPKKSPAKKESQIQLIEKFIKNEPQMGKKSLTIDESENQQEDLASKRIKNADEFITETFAQLLVKQKKNHRAIDIYEKLMLKFPKKTAYFASQIEKIKKEGNV